MENDLDYRKLMMKMVDVIAHDIRNPLNNILLSTAQFKLETLPEKEDTAFYIDIIERNCDRVNGLMEDMISIFHQQGLNPDTFDLTELLKELLMENEDNMGIKGIKSNPSLNIVVVAHFDRAKMKQGLLQVLNNAIEASVQGGTISVEVKEEGTEALVIFQDQGGGIDKEVFPYIFVPFFTAKERHKGLGLALIRNVLDAHQGRIQFNTGSSGTEVIIGIPRQM